MNVALEQLRLLHAGPRDLIEVLIVAFVLYRVLLLIQGTRAVQMLIGIVVLVLVYAVAWLTKLTMITYLLDNKLRLLESGHGALRRDIGRDNGSGSAPQRGNRVAQALCALRATEPV